MNKNKEAPTCELCNARVDNIFAGANKEELDALSASKTCLHFKRGKPIFEEGQRPQGLFCIHEGKVKVYKLGDEGREQIIRLAKPGNVLGYRSLISGEAYKASASALEDSEVCFIPANTIYQLLEENPDISWRMMQIFSDDLKNAESRLTDFSQKPVRERLAQALLSLNEMYGEDDLGYLNIYLTRQEWANYMGTTTETAIRTISEFNKEGLIEIKGKRIKIKEPDQLDMMAAL